MTNFFDIPVFNFINHALNNQFFNFTMPVISRLGKGELYFALAILFLFSKKKELKTLGVFLLAGLTISYYTVAVLKIFVARPRPFMALANVILLGPVEKGYSFPSNHAVTAFMFASLLAGRFKKIAFDDNFMRFSVVRKVLYTFLYHKKQILFYSLAALMSFSRIYLGVHYPSDVLAGAVIGIMIGLFLVRTMHSD